MATPTAVTLDNRSTGTHLQIDKHHLASIGDQLIRVLADSYNTYLYTQFTHWNVRGIEFFSLHQLFESQYKELASAVDSIAERLRTLGFKAPGSLSGFAEASSFDPKQTTDVPSMIKELIGCHEATLKTLREAGKAAQSGDDLATEDFLIARLGQHEKMIWMLRSLLN
ncbi:MAG: DNA starvation/stationary phase protection protein [Hahellaceae bacterium]|nr:DNA starvation/stationary phase protection protein [Hahellaceae bacterium]